MHRKSGTEKVNILRCAIHNPFVSHITRDDLRCLRKRLRQLINEEGLHPTSNRTGIPVGQIRSLLSGRAALTTTVSSVCASLGLDFTSVSHANLIPQQTTTQRKTLNRTARNCHPGRKSWKTISGPAFGRLWLEFCRVSMLRQMPRQGRSRFVSWQLPPGEVPLNWTRR